MPRSCPSSRAASTSPSPSSALPPITKGAPADTVLSLTGFALVGGPARQDHPKAIDSPRSSTCRMVTVPLSFQTRRVTDSTLGLHPVQVALRWRSRARRAARALIFSGRDSKTGRPPAPGPRARCGPRPQAGGAPQKKNVDKKLAITVFSFPDKGNVGTAAYLNVRLHLPRPPGPEGGRLRDGAPPTRRRSSSTRCSTTRRPSSSPDLNVDTGCPSRSTRSSASTRRTSTRTGVPAG